MPPAAPPPPSSVPPPYTAGQTPPGDVPNPAYRELYQRYAAAYGSADTLRECLNAPHRTFLGTDAWLGPEARTWGEDLTSSRRRLQTAADTILWAIYERVTATPRSLTTS
ncbi:hypothetical protein LO762_17340 [Actinocorallia sp. API 0066]|uniref:hypothetical protein n=1 Tax=Actinocorallia sp. API 0066 TaxID=2896846 RepID=UPI001E3B847A|nr:hypothetical protein [Actinocorallia sp. API 0066]MCD0450945.1 hypothetical protein [Actinocorallia sp. API 0066]